MTGLASPIQLVPGSGRFASAARLDDWLKCLYAFLFACFWKNTLRLLRYDGDDPVRSR
jgi:hypothetical protein